MIEQLSIGSVSLVTLATAALLLIVLVFVTYGIYFERKVIGWIQLRQGPNRTGPFGLLQTVADVFKLLIKEDTIPNNADKTVFKLGPIISFIPAFVVLAVIPYTENLYFANLNVGLLYYVALSGISTIGILMGGWASNNKYALLGGMRSVAQMISYEIPLVISMVGVILMTGSLNMIQIVEGQAGGFWSWNIFPQIVAFGIFIIAAVAELNRTPFDLPEAESELIAGYHVEYSGFRFAFYMLSEYVYIYAIAGLTTVLFLGGWHAPFAFLSFIPGLIWFIIKFCSIVFFLFWIRATMPRLRVDHLMGLGWKVLLPLSLVNIFVTAIVLELLK
ncbi:NADH-quinone oxidoreductase subunit NuoH [Longirhabdus pacifica]|uniref:NADH-quinone oxidoreductase subunit NuoH n=1 Tax=Longirhabdus pacifica TaxID=2305227 RepID=UPI001F0CDA50|nr:NADH-quinone oxidoreductase subunit NuoH [Longirhabdus pacifica]